MHLFIFKRVLAWLLPVCGVAWIIASARFGSVPVASNNGSMLLLRPADDKHLAAQTWRMWIAVTGCIFFFAASVALLRRRSLWWWLHLVLMACVGALAAYPFLVGQPGIHLRVQSSFVQKLMLTWPLLQWAYCADKLDWHKNNANSGRPIYLFNTWSNRDPKDYDGGYVVKPPPSLRPVAIDGELVEVVHTPENANGVAWHYVLPGTGVHARFFKIRTHTTHREFVLSMGLPCADYECYGAIDRAFALASSEGYDAVQFTAHADVPCGEVLTELVALNASGRAVCPLQYMHRNGTPCACSASLQHSNCGYPLNRAQRPCYPAVAGAALVLGLAGIALALAQKPFTLPHTGYTKLVCLQNAATLDSQMGATVKTHDSTD